MFSNTRRAAGPDYAARVADVRRRLRQIKAQAVLVTNPRDIRYLTGFVGDDSWAVVLGKSNKVTIITDFRFREQVVCEAPQARAVIRKNGLSEEVLKLIDTHRVQKIAMQAEYTTLSQRATLAKKVGARRLVEAEDGLLKQRAVKSDDEVRLIRKAVAIQQEALRLTAPFIKPGRREEEVAAKLEYHMRMLGADGPSFNSIVAADANASNCHAIPGARKLKKGGIVLIDWGARYRGYCSDMTRVLAIGRMPAKISEIYKVVLEAQLAGIDAIGPGVPCKAVDKAARDVIEKAGYGEEFGHGLGHGIGLNIHEWPRLGAKSDDVLQPGHVVTVEPGIYLPGVGGVRIEDDVLVTARGKTVLCDLPKSLESAII